ncbi:MAG: hypothetical protein AAGL10_02105 [Pseudomonadota bacterium]
MSRDFILPAIFTIMAIAMTVFPDRDQVFGTSEDASQDAISLASASDL